MELQQLKHFLAVQRLGGFRRAAESLNISQPALSQSIGNLEDSLGAALFERGPQGTHITPYGQTLISYASNIMREVSKARDELDVLRGLQRGRVNVGALSTFSSHIVPEVVGRFIAAYPNIEVAVTVHLWPELSKLLETGELDFVYSLWSPELVHGTEFESIPQQRCRSLVYARSDHPLAGRKNVTLEQMAKFDWVVTNQSIATDYLIRMFGNGGVAPPKIAVRTDSFSLIRAMVREQPLLCMMPDNTTAEDLRGGRLVEIDQRHIAREQTTALIFSKRISQTPAAMAMMQAFQQYAGLGTET
ncbi:MAG: LysR family transcriptional regulator [Rhodospirillaceae bacterium]|nr:LysR family transcriptional regulator [Rhodospirillaceae bacterium]